MRRLLNIICVVFAFMADAQVDSLRQELKRATSDTSKINLMIQIGDQHLDSSKYYHNKAYSLAQEVEWFYGQGRVLQSIGLGLIRAQKSDSAIIKWNLALVAYQRDLENTYTKRTEDRLGHTHYNIAIPHYLNGDYLLAISHLKSSLDFYLNVNNSSRIISCYNLLGIVYFEQDDIELAKEQYEQSLQFALEIKDQSNIANGYNNLGSVMLETKQYEEALKYYQLSLEMEDQEDSQSIVQTKMNIGQTYTLMGRYDEAQKLLEEGVEALKNSQDPRDQIISLNLLSDLYEAKKEWRKVIAPAKKSLEISVQMGMQNQQKESVENLSIAYESLGNTQLAFDYYKQFTALKDSLFNQEKTKEVESLKAQLEFDKKEREIGELTQANLEKEVALSEERNTRNIILFSGAGLLLILGVIWILYRRKEERRRHALELKKLEIEQRMLRSQMNPHFIFNALNSIQSFITTNNTYEAEVFMSKFSMLVRKILENSTHKIISLEEEIETLQLYLELEKSRFEERFDFEIVEDADSTLSIPPMLLQPFIENAIIHGMKGKKGKGHIHVRFIEEEDTLRCEVEDDGVGRSEKASETDHKSLATSLTNDRISFFNEASTAGEFDLKIIDLQNEIGVPSGTKVILTIPLA